MRKDRKRAYLLANYLYKIQECRQVTLGARVRTCLDLAKHRAMEPFDTLATINHERKHASTNLGHV